MAYLRRPVVYVFSEIKGLIGELNERLQNVTIQNIPATTTEASNVLAELQKAEILLTDPSVISPYISDLPDLKWMMFTWAGVNSFVANLDPSKPLPSYTLTRFAGSLGTPIGEYVVGHIIAYERKFALMKGYQQKKNWTECYGEARQYRLLSALTLGILGAGDIGTEIARLAKPFGMKTKGLVRSLEGKSRSQSVDSYRSIDELEKFMEECDYICNVLPSTPATRGMLTSDVMAHCQHKKSVFINVGRGDVVKESTLLEALKNGWLRHVILDVFEEEPLPSTSELWQHDDVTITPHVSGVSFPDQVAELFQKQYERYCRNEPLMYTVDLAKGY